MVSTWYASKRLLYAPPSLTAFIKSKTQQKDPNANILLQSYVPSQLPPLYT